jgi:glycosyltransferase involved in cell wall biosynthesis
MANIVESMKRSMLGNQAAGCILHVPYTYFPDPCGGTEVYVRSLARRLSALGYANVVAAPAASSATYEHAGLPVYRFGTDLRPRLDLAYGIPDEIAAEGFRTIVAQARPHIVHLHARTAAVSERLVDVAHAAGARVVFTYHTPTASCARGTMMLFGERPCDGIVETKRCMACTFAARGMPKPLARAAAAVPDTLYARAVAFTGPRRLSALRIPGLIASNQRRFLDFIAKVDHVVAVSQWVTDVLRRNAVPVAKITLSRQGMDAPAQVPRPTVLRAQVGPLKIAYFGRIDRGKGPDLLARALKLIPNAPAQIDIFAVRQSAGPDQTYDWLSAQARHDPRLTLRAPIAPDKVIGTMADYDLIAVPSRGFETGPLVVLEAFAAGVPVLGANLGGIAELVRDGVDGILVAPDDAAAWAAMIRRLAEDRDVIDALRARIVPPRTMDAAAEDMATLYARILPILSPSSASSSLPRECDTDAKPD